MLNKLIASGVSYVIGSYPTAYFTAKFCAEKNVFTNGDGNMGGTNALIISKSYKIFIIVAIIDIIKGFLAAALSFYMIKELWTATLISGIFSTLGHNYSIFKSFKGGKGASTNAGTFLYINPWLAVIFGLTIITAISINQRLRLTKKEIIETIMRILLFSLLTLLYLPEYTIHALILQLVSLLKYATEKQLGKKLLKMPSLFHNN